MKDRRYLINGCIFAVSTIFWVVMSFIYNEHNIGLEPALAVTSSALALYYFSQYFDCQTVKSFYGPERGPKW